MKSFLFLIFFVSFSCLAQQSIEWSRCYGGTNHDFGSNVLSISESRMLICGETQSSDGDISFNHGYSDCWVAMLDTNSNIIWEKSIGGSNVESPTVLLMVNQDNYIMVGETRSNDGDIITNHDSTGNSNDGFLIFIDSSGTIKRSKCYGGTKDDYITSIVRTIDNGFIFVGATKSNDGDVSGNHNINGVYSDYWVVKLDSVGNIQWQKCFGGTDEDIAYSVVQTSDSGYIVAGSSKSIDGDVTNGHALGYSDYWLLKLTKSGNLLWQKSFGSPGNDYCRCLIKLQNNYLIAGYTYSVGGDIIYTHGLIDGWIINVDESGHLRWQKSIGGTSDDLINSMISDTEGNIIIAGSSGSNDGDLAINHGGLDYWILKLDTTGNILWSKSYGGSNDEESMAIAQNINGNYAAIGYTESNDGDVSGSHSVNQEIWLLELSSTVDINEYIFSDVEIYPNPSNEYVFIKGNSANEDINILFYDIYGRLLDGKKFNFNNARNIKIDISRFPQNVLIIKLICKNYSKQFKILVNH